MKMGKLEKRFVNRAGHSQRVSRRAEKLLSHTDPRPGQRYLDVGTGNGRAAIDMAVKHRLEVTGIDIDREQVRLAQAVADGIQNVQFMTLDGRDLPFADGAFDIVSAFKVTHHITDWQEAVEEMIRVLRVGGYFVFADLVVPESVAALGTKFIKGVGFPTAAGLTRVVEANGLILYMLREEPFTTRQSTGRVPVKSRAHEQKGALGALGVRSCASAVIISSSSFQAALRAPLSAPLRAYRM